MDDLGEIYLGALRTATKIAEYEKSDIAVGLNGARIFEVAGNLFIGYIDKTSRQYKGSKDENDRGNNATRPASEGQIGLVRDLMVEMGARGEKALQDMRDSYGLEKLPHYEELQELDMGQAHTVIDYIKSKKVK